MLVIPRADGGSLTSTLKLQVLTKEQKTRDESERWKGEPWSGLPRSLKEFCLYRLPLHLYAASRFLVLAFIDLAALRLKRAVAGLRPRFSR